MSTLAALEKVRTPTVTVAIRRLEKLGLVVRRPDPSDRRAVLAQITKRGDSIYDDSLKARQARLVVLLTALSAHDRAILHNALPVLERLVDSKNT
jgi:DNA-binding MarR family transcriptional regulator